MVTKTKPKKETKSQDTTVPVGHIEMIRHIKLEDLLPNPYQPATRIDVDPETAKKFASSIWEHGLIQLPLVRPGKEEGKYEVGDGWLRRAGFLFNFKDMALEQYGSMPCQIKDLTDQQMADLVMEANTIRKDLNPIELARLYQRYLEDFKITQADLAKRHNCSQGEIANTIRLLELPDDIRADIISQEISETHGRQLLRLNEFPDLQEKALDGLKKRPRPVAEFSNDIARELYYYGKILGESCGFESSEECQGCEWRRKLGSPCTNGKKLWMCFKPECFLEKQRVAKQDEIDKALAKAKAEVKEGELKLVSGDKLPYDSYARLYGWDGKPEFDLSECQGCDQHVLISNRYSGDSSHSCLNKACFRKKKSAATRADNAKRKEREQKDNDRLKVALFALDSENHDILRTALHVLAESMVKNMYHNVAIKLYRLADVPVDTKRHRVDRQALQGQIKDMDCNDLLRLLVAIIYAEEKYYRSSSEATPTWIMNRLKEHQTPENSPEDKVDILGSDSEDQEETVKPNCYKAFSFCVYPDCDKCPRTQPPAKISRKDCIKCSPDKTGHCAFCGRRCEDKDGNYIPQDPLADLLIQTATDGQKEHCMKLGDIDIRGETLRDCALLLGKNMGWGNTAEDILLALSGFSSQNSKLLVSILEGQK